MRHPIASALAVLALAAGCSSSGKPPADDDFGDLAEALAAERDAKGDTLESMIVGSLSYGQTSSSIYYSDPPRYRIVKFAADAGDNVVVRISSIGGDAVAWLLDDDLAQLGYNDDASAGTFDAAISLRIPSHPSRTHYVVFRDYFHRPAHFRVTLRGEPAGCAVDADCAMVESGCCHVGDWTAVPDDEVDAFEASKACPADPECPVQPIIYRGEQAICDGATHACTTALPEVLSCGGLSTNAHRCPDGWSCQGPEVATDGTGRCVAD
jgi:hypothetical protein